MKQRNRILALLMALCLAVSVLVVPASAADLEQLKTQLEEAKAAVTAAEQALRDTQAAKQSILDIESSKQAEYAAAKDAYNAAVPGSGTDRKSVV